MTQKSYRDDELEHVPAVLLGGPLDGKRYRMPVFPDGGIPHNMSSPLTQPAETSAHAHYCRSGDSPIGGYYVYFFAEIVEHRVQSAVVASTEEHA